MDAEMNRKLSAVSPEEVETDTVKQEYGERMKKENLVSVLPGQIFPY